MKWVMVEYGLVTSTSVGACYSWCVVDTAVCDGWLVSGAAHTRFGNVTRLGISGRKGFWHNTGIGYVHVSTALFMFSSPPNFTSSPFHILPLILPPLILPPLTPSPSSSPSHTSPSHILPLSNPPPPTSSPSHPSPSSSPSQPPPQTHYSDTSKGKTYQTDSSYHSEG